MFVAIDAHGQPRTVPPLTLETDDDVRRYAEAKIRREHRLARRDAILASRSRRAATLSRERSRADQPARDSPHAASVGFADVVGGGAGLRLRRTRRRRP